MHMSLKISRNFLILHPVLEEATSLMLQLLYTLEYCVSAFFTVSVCVFLTPRISYLCTCVLMCFIFLHACALDNRFINFQMTTWLFRDVLAELEMRGHFDESVLWSAQGLCMGDICFTEIQTTFKMHVVPFHMFLQFVEKGSFNADNLPADDYSHTTSILLAFVPDPRLADIKRVGIGNVIWWCRTPLGDIASTHVVIDQICMILAIEHKKDSARHRVYMMHIGNYGGHMAFATDPPYCVAYAADYKNTDDPSKMTPCEPLNHTFTMPARNMVVRRLLSVPNWEPTERKLTMGGCLLIPRGLHFGPKLFPDLVILRNHLGPLIDSITWQEMPFQMVGPFQATDLIFPSLPGDLELFTAKEVAKLKELGVLNPPNVPEHLPLFPPLVFSGRGKVVSATLGAPPPDLDTHGIGQFLVTDQDEESVLSDSYSDHHSNTVDSGIMWDRHTMHSSEEEQKLRTTEHRDRDGHKPSDKDHDRNCERECEKSKKSDNQHSSDWPQGCSPQCRDHNSTYECSANGKCERSHVCDSPSDSCKTKQRHEVSASLLHDCRKSHTPECQPLPPPPMFHSTPIAAPCRLSSDPTSAHLSFDQSWGSLPPIDLGGGKPHPISSMSAPIQAGILSVPGPLPLPSESVSALRLTVDHTKEIFNLACEGCQLKERVMWEFAKLSNQEVLFHTQAQSTGYEMLARRHPDCFTVYYVILWSNQESLEAKDKAIEELVNKAERGMVMGQRASLFKHVLDYEAKLDVHS